MKKRNRKNSKATKHRKRARNQVRCAALYKFLCVVVVLVAGFLAVALFFKVERFEIIGNTRYDEAEIIQTLGVEKEDNLILLNKREIMQALHKKFVYMDEIQVTRGLPDTLRVVITECQPVAAAAYEGGCFLLDAKGKVLEEISGERPTGYLSVYGLDAAGMQVGEYLSTATGERERQLQLLLGVLAEANLTDKITYISVENLTSLELGYENRFNVLLGSVDELEKKVEFLLEITGERLASSDTGMIDLHDATTARFRPLNTISEEELAGMRNFDGSPRQTAPGEEAGPPAADGEEETVPDDTADDAGEE